MSYLTQKQMNRIFENWADNDPNIQQFGWGALYNQAGIPTIEQVYPGLYVVPGQEALDSKSLTRKYQIFIYDLVWEQDGGSNIATVHSEATEIMHRLRRWLDDDAQADYFELADIKTITDPFRDKWLDDVAGVTATFELVVNTNSSCADPDNDFEY